MRKEVVFSDFFSAINEKEYISKSYAEGKWKTFSYETGRYNGNMLVCPQDNFPEDVSLDLNLEGLYDIYVCLPNFPNSSNYINFKLSSDPGYDGVHASGKAPFNWTPDEFLEEIYWKTADVSGQKFMIRKADSSWITTAGIAWVRFVPTDKKESADNKCVQMHIDEDIVAIDSLKTDGDYLARLYPLKDANTDFVSFEFSFDYGEVPEQKYAHLLKMDAHWDINNYKYAAKKDMVYKNAVKYAKENGFGIYAANRMQVGSFITPYTRYGWNMQFVQDNPQFLSRTRTGTRVNACSYAYDEVQNFVIEQFKKMVKYGFDGISLIFHRGHYIAFDEPVIKRFNKLYPNVNPNLLPIADDRINGVWCEIMTEFMTKLRNAMGKDIKINVITDYSLETAKHIGLDVEYWAKSGLIDCVSQADMEIFEDLEGCMDDKNPGLIDLEKYQYQLTQRTVVRRNFCKNTEKVLKHIPEYCKLKDYGVKVYHVLPWVHTTDPDEYKETVEQMKKLGAENFLCWNTNHVMTDLTEWHTIRGIGNNDIKQTLRSFCRVLTIDGFDISQYHPNWRG